jgi:hypothetical protein
MNMTMALIGFSIGMGIWLGGVFLLLVNNEKWMPFPPPGIQTFDMVWGIGGISLPFIGAYLGAVA